MIEFNTLYGQKILLPKEKATFRPSAYAIIVKDGKILLVTTKRTGKYFFPGGAADIEETIKQTLKRELMEEVGIYVTIKDLIHFEENFFYYNPTDEAWHSLLLFFHCSTDNDLPKNHKQIDEDEAINPEWIAIKDLTPENFQDAGKGVFIKIQKMFE